MRLSWTILSRSGTDCAPSHWIRTAAKHSVAAQAPPATSPPFPQGDQFVCKDHGFLPPVIWERCRYSTRSCGCTPASLPENLSTAGCSCGISGFLYTSFTNCSPQTGQNPVSLEHKEAASRKSSWRANSSLLNRHSSISPLFSLFLSRKAAGSHAGGFSSVCAGASGQIRTAWPAEKMRPAAPSGAFLIIWFPA